ncbi:MAG TPA: carboxylating nicotinate-nucleotide diphosphorylase [Gemmataceae bacterium]|nr:carboxylating nicotinate-nucleotide diphosphorylase [Gemmataceae bacterium]
MFSATETEACRRLVELALEEDLGTSGDFTSQAVIAPEQPGCAAFVARTRGVLAGLPAVSMVFAAVDPHLLFQPKLEDGSSLVPGAEIAHVAGRMRSILAAERIALNFLQHLSGVATQTRLYVDAVAGLACQILDTRKTLPGWRLLEKYAVRQGGGHNHRLGLQDGMLIKDNHLAALGGGRQALQAAIAKGLSAIVPPMSLEIEVDTLDQLDMVLPCHPHIVLLDNMTPEQLRAAVTRRNQLAPQVLLEASGGITMETVRAVAETGVDRISVGALTHSAGALDIALDYMN